jgi:RNA polymerase sigma factor (sigma-70 family)
MTAASTTREQTHANSSLDAFLLELGGLPLLPPARVNELATAIRSEEAAFRAALDCLPAVSWLVVEQWEERRAENRVTGLLSHYYRDDPSQDWSVFIDERVGHLASLLRSGAPWEQVGEALGSASIRFETLQEMFLIVRGLADETPAPAAVRRLRELGVEGRKWRSQLARAERALAARDSARQDMAAHNLRLVVHVAKRFRGNGVPFADLIQEGGLGLMRAVDKFDPELGYRFSTYAVWWIEQSMIRGIQKFSRTVRVPSQIYEEQVRVKRAEQELRGCMDREPGAAAIAQQMGKDPASVERIFRQMAPAISLDAPLSQGDGGGDDRRIGDRLEDVGASALEERTDVARARDVLDRVLRTLNPRDRKVLMWRFGLGGEEELTLQAIGDRLSLSRERVRQIANEALAALKKKDCVRGLEALVSTSQGS